MILYLLSISDCEGEDILGLYSSREKAIESFPFQGMELDESNIREIEVDAPNKSPRYDKFFCFSIRTDGTTWSTPVRMSVDGVNEYHFSSCIGLDGMFSCTAYGRTIQEAEYRAREGLKNIHPVWQVGRYNDNSSGFCEVHHPDISKVHKWEGIPGNNGYAIHEDLETARQIFITYETTGRALTGFVSPVSI